MSASTLDERNELENRKLELLEEIEVLKTKLTDVKKMIDFFTNSSNAIKAEMDTIKDNPRMEKKLERLMSESEQIRAKLTKMTEEHFDLKFKLTALQVQYQRLLKKEGLLHSVTVKSRSDPLYKKKFDCLKEEIFLNLKKVAENVRRENVLYFFEFENTFINPFDFEEGENDEFISMMLFKNEEKRESTVYIYEKSTASLSKCLVYF